MEQGIGLWLPQPPAPTPSEPALVPRVGQAVGRGEVAKGEVWGFLASSPICHTAVTEISFAHSSGDSSLFFPSPAPTSLQRPQSPNPTLSTMSLMLHHSSV